MRKVKSMSCYFLAFIFPIILFALLYAIKGIYPFGETSNYIWDLEIQYHDFFCYFKDVISGKAGAEYTFSQSLGGSPIALIGYYLMSPVNLLVIFFKKSQMQLFVYFAASLKLGLCGLSCYIFIRKRFNLQNNFCLILSLAYSFTQYTIGQASNIMWLDGVYMLPLIMLGIYLYVKDGKKLLFYIANALSIVFCWYTGYMNCLFSVLYYIFERLLKETSFNFREQFVKLSKFLFLEFLSVLLSFFVFLPVVMRQSDGRGVLDSGIFDFATNGKFFEILKGFGFGTIFPGTQITLFCTVAVLLFFFSFWFSKFVITKEKIAACFLLGIMVASLFFKPIENIWCGFKFESSYIYRFAYLAFMTVICIAAMQIKKLYRDGALNLSDKSLAFGGGVFILILLVSDWINSIEAKWLWFEIALILFYIAALYIVANSQKLKSHNTRKFIKSAVSICFAAVFLLEVFLNSKFVVGNFYEFDAQKTSKYTLSQEELIENIKKSDSGFYRIEQTLSRNPDDVCGFYANESLAYGYSGVQSYTSCYDGLVSDIVVDAGYCTSHFPSFYYGPILPMDSLLGVRYLLSQNEYSVYQKTDIPSANQKDVYYNPYALPLGFKVEDTIFEEINHNNSFEYVNELYSTVLGEPTKIFKKIEDITSSQVENEVIFSFTNCSEPDGSILYVSFENNDIVSNALHVNGKQVSTYCRPVWGSWNNISYLGNIEQIEEVSLVDCNLSVDEINEEFYCVDMVSFTEAISKLKSSSIELSTIVDGYVKAQYSADQDGQIMLTIPYDEGWKVTVNGEKVDVKAGIGQFVVIPVNEGSNQIEMEYSMKGKLAGAIASIISVIIFVFMSILRRKRLTRRNSL